MPLPNALIARAAARSTATLHEAGQRVGALPAIIKPLAPDVRLCGRAYPVSSPAGDNLWLHHAIYRAAPGDVLVVAAGDREYGYWGEVMAVAAQARALAGLVIDGGVRDTLAMLALGFPVFSTPASIRGTGKDPAGRGSLGTPVTIGEVQIHHGDLIVGDADGVVVLPSARAEEIVVLGERRDAAEEEIFRRLRAGATTLEIYDLDHPRHLARQAGSDGTK
jgi:4-hydroxy-4-methyl-2-oxoglutarate aldolase